MSGNNYSLKNEAKTLNQQIKGLSDVQKGFIIALYFGESVEEEINPDYPDQSLLDEDIPYQSLTKESIQNIQQNLKQVENWLESPNIIEMFEDTNFDELDIGYYAYMHMSGHGVSIGDNGENEFTKLFCEMISYNPPWTTIDFDEENEEYQVFVSFG